MNWSTIFTLSLITTSQLAHAIDISTSPFFGDIGISSMGIQDYGNPKHRLLLDNLVQSTDANSFKLTMTKTILLAPGTERPLKHELDDVIACLSQDGGQVVAINKVGQKRVLTDEELIALGRSNSEPDLRKALLQEFGMNVSAVCSMPKKCVLVVRTDRPQDKAAIDATTRFTIWDQFSKINWFYQFPEEKEIQMSDSIRMSPDLNLKTTNTRLARFKLKDGRMLFLQCTSNVTVDDLRDNPYIAVEWSDGIKGKALNSPPAQAPEVTILR